MPRDSLPIADALPGLLAALRRNSAVILRAPTGAGKTTRVPPAIVESGLAGNGTIVVLEPRRVAARAAARRMASEHGSALGDVFGYQVRFDRVAGPRTRVLVVTPGVLLRMLHDNPYLDGVAGVVFDEFHERGIEADLALGMVKLVRENVRPELLAVVMSATIDPGPIAAFLGNAPVVDSAGRIFPVDITYRPRRPDSPVPRATADAIEAALDMTQGDILAFLPGLREIRQTADELERLAAERNLLVLPLHGDLPPEQQDRALQRLDRRKIVLAQSSANITFASDPTLLKRSLGNLLRNALEACQPGETVTLSCQVQGGDIVFAVHNPGAIPPASQLQIFNHSFTTKGLGRGLGTYSVKLLIERYLKGRVHFISTPEVGTTFYVTLPVIPKEAGNAGLPASAS